MDFEVNSHLVELKPLNKHTPKALKDLSGLDIPYVLSFGGALGLYRDGDFLPTDTDIDVDVIGFEGIGDHLKDKFKEYDLFREVSGDGKPMQMAFIKRGVVLDFCIFWGEDELLHSRPEGQWIMYRSWIENPARVSSKYGLLPVPGKIKKYLTMRYGNWTVPKDEKAQFI